MFPETRAVFSNLTPPYKHSIDELGDNLTPAVNCYPREAVAAADYWSHLCPQKS